MKKLLLTLAGVVSLLAISLSIVFVSISASKEKQPPKQEESRIKIIETDFFTSIRIIEVDGKEYLVNDNGGIIELKKD